MSAEEKKPVRAGHYRLGKSGPVFVPPVYEISLKAKEAALRRQLVEFAARPVPHDFGGDERNQQIVLLVQWLAAYKLLLVGLGEESPGRVKAQLRVRAEMGALFDATDKLLERWLKRHRVDGQR